MKKFYVFFILFLIFSSCNSDDDNDYSRYELFYDEITKATVPATMQVGDTYEITFYTELETLCENLVDFSYQRIGNERFITAISANIISNSCAESVRTDSLTFRFTPTQETTYTFKFWQGQDVDGKDLYEIHEAVASQ